MSLDLRGSDKHGSLSPPYETPLRHHKRKPSTPREVKETLHAHSEWSNSGDDGAAVHKINQYIIGEEIGRGSFGSVHLAVDQYGREYAVKEFSKSRLRKRAQSNILRRPHGPGRGFFSPQNSRILSRSGSGTGDGGQAENPLFLIKEEIAIMKKLNHPSLVCLLEVLDDPDEDSLYMVLEMCKKGVIMKVGMHETADPYDAESCRCWFRDLILGIEYLHAQGVAHRDIKPDNLLLNDEDELKIVDFGVSEMFEKTSDLLSAKSAGSPAFLPPELCVSKHGNVSGRAADIWSMGITLYCLYFGRVPFEKTNILELYESIRDDEPHMPDDVDPTFKDLMLRILAKEPEKRIKMSELREHAWVTKDGTDALMSEEENVSSLVEPPTEEEVNRAITKNMGNLLVVVKAVKQFKRLLSKRQLSAGGILGPSSQIVQPPMRIDSPDPRPTRFNPQSGSKLAAALVKLKTGRSGDHAVESSATTPQTAEDDGEDGTGVMVTSPDTFSPPPTAPSKAAAPPPQQKSSSPRPWSKAADPRQQHRVPTVHEGKGQAHDPLTDTIYLGVGAKGTEASDEDDETQAISESPLADDTNIYELAYQAEIERIRKERGHSATIYMTRRVDMVREHLKDHVREISKSATISGGEQMSAIESVVENATRKARGLAEAKGLI